MLFLLCSEKGQASHSIDFVSVRDDASLRNQINSKAGGQLFIRRPHISNVLTGFGIRLHLDVYYETKRLTSWSIMFMNSECDLAWKLYEKKTIFIIIFINDN